MKIRRLHFVRLVLRSILFAAATVIYIIDRDALLSNPYFGISSRFNLLLIIWIFFAVDMLMRFFPSDDESMGCQKQFAKNFSPIEAVKAVPEAIKRKNRQAAAMAAAAWIALNGVIGALHLSGVLDKGILMLISLFYSVCDIVCILFYCPFQSLLMKNRCCITCRIYNWDYAMIFTPAVFIRSWYTWSLLALALALLIRWEITYHRSPERFSESTNSTLACANCREHLCKHKRSIRRFTQKAIDAIQNTASEKLPELPFKNLREGRDDRKA